jgi:hypothetical protein
MGLWIGSSGTHTPLHHGTDNSVFCQVRGRKRFRLAPPASLGLLDGSRGVYSHWDPRDDAPANRWGFAPAHRNHAALVDGGINDRSTARPAGVE